MGGYQYDLSPGGDIDGLLYEERSLRSLGSPPGVAAVIALDGRRWRTGVLADDTKLRSIHRRNDWNEAGIRAIGNRIEFTKNGEKVLDFVLSDEGQQLVSGDALRVDGPIPPSVRRLDGRAESLPAQGRFVFPLGRRKASSRAFLLIVRPPKAEAH